MASPAPRTTLAAGTGVNRDVPRQDDVGRSRRITQLSVHAHAAVPPIDGGPDAWPPGPSASPVHAPIDEVQTITNVRGVVLVDLPPREPDEDAVTES